MVERYLSPRCCDCVAGIAIRPSIYGQMSLRFASGICAIMAAVATGCANVRVIKRRFPAGERRMAIFAARGRRDVVDAFCGDCLLARNRGAVVTREAGRYGNLAMIQFLTQPSCQRIARSMAHFAGVGGWHVFTGSTLEFA